MRHKKLSLLSLFVFILCSISSDLFAQGVTSGNLSGTVTAPNGELLRGASVSLLHQPTGSTYNAITLDDGRFTFSNLRVGGPYVVTISFVGYESVTENDIFITLGQTQQVALTLQNKGTTLQDITVNSTKNKAKPGGTTINNAQISRLPTIKRSFEDFARLNPQNQGFSFAGRNRLFNNLTIDGSIFNNPFGLDAPLPGGQANAQPISLDAIDQIAVSISPFDVKQSGFTGATVNAVTKSGTNTFRGSAYTFLRNKYFVGNKVNSTTLTRSALSYNQSGVSFGGPIIKNKVFFFVSGEIERRTEPAHNFLAKRAGLSGANVSNVDAAELDTVRSRMKRVYGYETGAYENYNHQTSNNKFSAKIDWNVDAHNTFIISYKYLQSYRDVLPNPAISPNNTGRGPNNLTLPFENTSYRINNNINSIVAEFNSRYGKFANNFQVSYTAFNDFREPKSAPFPSIDITYPQGGTNKISLGSEMFSTNNKLDQKVLQISNNLNYYLKNNTLTFGINYEQFKFNNSFNLFYYLPHTIVGIDDFKSKTNPNDPNYIDFNKAVADANKQPFANTPTNFAQVGVYVQDEWQATTNVKLTAGLRVDVPMYLNTLAPQPNIEALTWYDTKGNPINGYQINKYPKSTPILSPRLGFNYDVKNDKSTVLRGGTGIFLGRIPFVWLGNQSANQSLTPGYTFQLNGTANNFKFPRVWRTNIAFDQKLPWGIIATIDLMYGQDINAAVHRNYNMKPPSSSLNPVGAAGDNRPVFTDAEKRVNVAPTGSFLDAGLIVMENTNKGYQYTATVQLSKNIGNTLFLTTAYTYGVSMDITSNPGEIAANAFQTNPTKGNPNNIFLAHADHELKHRLILAGTYRKEYAKNLAFSVGLFGELTQGGPGAVIGEVGGRYSYTYTAPNTLPDDVNNDGIKGNDLIFIPKDQSQIIFTPAQVKDGLGTVIKTISAAQQWEDLNAFIEQDNYLKNNRGKIAERNGAITPAFARADLKITHDFSFKVSDKRKNIIQVSLDILNFGNFLNKEWGVRKTAANRNPLIYIGKDGMGRPQFNFAYDTNGQPLRKSFIDDTSLNSRWQAQFGVRYIF